MSEQGVSVQKNARLSNNNVIFADHLPYARYQGTRKKGAGTKSADMKPQH